MDDGFRRGVGSIRSARRRLITCFDLYSTATTLIGARLAAVAAARGAARMLDLGAGDGPLAGEVASPG
jgi:hypothetical protein